MFGIGIACITAAVAWVLTLNSVGLSGDADAFGLAGWYPRVFGVGAAVISVMAIARYLTHRDGRGLRLGLAGFVLAALVLLSGLAAVVYFRLGGSFASPEEMLSFASSLWAAYGAALLISASAFLASELITGRL